MTTVRGRLARARKLRFLRRAGAAQVDHSGEHLLDHLVATERLLAAWGARPALCDGALFHSVYGTQFLTDRLLAEDRRDEVRALIGAEAEALAWLWQGLRRDTLAANLDGRGDAELVVGLRDAGDVPVTRAQLTDLVDLWFADAVEQLPRRGPESYVRQEAVLTPFFGVAMPPAVAAARALFAAGHPSGPARA